jgi:ABC-type multidrug transport system ATPase subunit
MTIHPGAESPAALIATGIRKRYRGKLVLDGVSLSAAAGEAVALVGENGSGKTTLLRICAGALPPDGGSVAASGRVGYCPQEPAVLDLLCADEHFVLLGAALGLASHDAREAGRGILAELRFPIGDRTRAGELSGGSRQKLNLALALLGDPPLLLLDEPYQGFDQGSYTSFWDHVAVWRRQGKAIVIVSHVLPDPTLVDRIVELTVPTTGAGEEPR